MMRPYAIGILFATSLLLLLPACSEDPDETTLVTTVFAIDAPEGDGGSATVRDENGIFDLQAFPAFVALSVDAADMDRISAVWPELTADYVVGEQTVELDLDVPAGATRQVSVAVFTFQQDRPHCFTEPEPYFLDLTPGGTPTLDVIPEITGIGTVAGTAPDDASQVWLVDAETLVRLDRTMVDNGHFKFEYACAHRQLTLAWIDDGGGFHIDPLMLFSLLPDEDKEEMILPE
jgi:hypothetical protein